MSNSAPKFFKRPIRPGQPLATSGVVEAIMALAKALENLEIKSNKKSRIDWANGYPVIYIDEE